MNLDFSAEQETIHQPICDEDRKGPRNFRTETIRHAFAESFLM
jgi:hypothetical protein